MPFGLADSEFSALETESVELLRALLRLDTTNPPGNETICARLLADYLGQAGVDCELVGDDPARLNLVARLPGVRPGPTLLLLGHTDVVPAEAKEWSRPPFSGALEDGYIWGRGALDMKNQVAAEAVAVARLARAGAPFAGTLLLAATIDEERGERCGARWLLRERPDLVGCDYLLNEGGGSYLEIDGRRLFNYTVGEKGYAQFRITAHGRGGHGSVPLHNENAVELLGRLIVALAEHRLPVEVAPFTADFIDRLIPDRRLASRLKQPRTAREALHRLLAAGDDRAHLIEPLLGMTFSPTIVRAGGEATNVISSHAELLVDCRILPGHAPEEVEREVHKALAPFDGRWTFSWVDTTQGNESPPQTPLSESLERVLTAMLGDDVDLIPTHLCGFTDSRWFREALPDVVAYGFCPHQAENACAMGGREHAKDERIAVSDVPFQALYFERAALDLLSVP